MCVCLCVCCVCVCVSVSVCVCACVWYVEAYAALLGVLGWPADLRLRKLLLQVGAEELRLQLRLVQRVCRLARLREESQVSVCVCVCTSVYARVCTGKVLT